jgi:D-aminopeptidase
VGGIRARDLGIEIGRLPAGPLNAITDVPGVRVGHRTLIAGDGPLRVGDGPVRTGVTLIVPHDGDPWRESLFAGCHRLNGNGELTGMEWIREAGLLGGVIGLTNTHSVGVVRDALIGLAVEAGAGDDAWALPVVGETYDGVLNDINGFHVRAEDVREAYAAASDGRVAEGNVGGGTGMICHEFKGGIGTASRRLPDERGGWTVGVLVQANYGRRDLLRIDGVPVGREIGTDAVPSAWDAFEALSAARGELASAGAVGGTRAGEGSIIVIVATDAPLLPHQCARLAQRPSLGLGRLGSYASNGSGDLFLAFASGNRGLPASDVVRSVTPRDVRMLDDSALDPLFEAVVEGTEEAVVNALVAAETLTGRDGLTAHALPHHALVGVMQRYARPA